MIERTHRRADGVESVALYSPCERYRYGLSRRWGNKGRMLTYIMLNPSKATEAANDPTIERCERRAAQLGFDGLHVTNIFALRETDPHVLRRAELPEGPENFGVLDRLVKDSAMTLCAWGVHGAHLGQGARVAAQLRESNHVLHVLGLTKEGHPRHPLYMPYSAKPVLWDQTAVRN